MRYHDERDVLNVSFNFSVFLVNYTTVMIVSHFGCYIDKISSFVLSTRKRLGDILT